MPTVREDAGAIVEVRARLACGRGIWPAIWMLGTDGKAGWPALGEIDIKADVSRVPALADMLE